MSSEPHIVKILPSLILYNNCDNETFDEVSVKATAGHDDNRLASLDQFCQRVLEKGEYPRLQVIERNRCLYTINNTRLALFQRLEQSGYCGKVKVEIMPLKTIPPGLRDVLCPQGHVTSRMSYWGKLSRGYKLLGSSSLHSQDDNENDDDEDNEADDGVACRAEKTLECYRNRYEETALDSTTDDDDDDDDEEDDDDDDDNDDDDGCDCDDGDNVNDNNDGDVVSVESVANGIDNEAHEDTESTLEEWNNIGESERSGLIEHHHVSDT